MRGPRSIRVLIVLGVLSAVLSPNTALADQTWLRAYDGPLPSFVEWHEMGALQRATACALHPPPGLSLHGVQWDHGQRQYTFTFSSDNLTTGCALSVTVRQTDGVNQSSINAAMRQTPPPHYVEAQQAGATMGPLTYVEGATTVGGRWWDRQDGVTTWHGYSVILRHNNDAVFSHRSCWSRDSAGALTFFESFGGRVVLN